MLKKLHKAKSLPENFYVSKISCIFEPESFVDIYSQNETKQR